MLNSKDSVLLISDSIKAKARRLTGNRATQEDLVQEGYVAALESVPRYRGDNNCQISSYLQWAARKAIWNSFQQSKMPFRAPRGALKKLGRVRTVEFDNTPAGAQEPQPTWGALSPGRADTGLEPVDQTQKLISRTIRERVRSILDKCKHSTAVKDVLLGGDSLHEAAQKHGMCDSTLAYYCRRASNALRADKVLADLAGGDL